MEKISINTSSWHYRLNSKFNCMYTINDSCDYNRATIVSLLASTFILTLIVFGVSVIGTIIGYLAAFVTSGVFIADFMILPILVFSVVICFAWLIRVKKVKEEQNKPSAIKELYKSFKEKYCKQIEFK